MAWVEKDHSAHLVPTPCYVQGRQPADQAAQSHIQPGLECLQGWSIQSLLGQPVQCVTTLCVKNFLLISNLNLPFLILKPWYFLAATQALSLLTFSGCRVSNINALLNTTFWTTQPSNYPASIPTCVQITSFQQDCQDLISVVLLESLWWEEPHWVQCE